MKFLQRYSLVIRILTMVGIAFAATALGVFLLVDGMVDRVLHRGGLEIYSERVDAIVRQLDQRAARLTPDLDPVAFKEQALQDIVVVHFQDSPQEIFPVVIDLDGTVLRHRNLSPGDRSHMAASTLPDFASQPQGEIDFHDVQGREMWAVYQVFEPWGWVVGYSVPRDVLMADATLIQQRLLGGWAVVAALALLALAIFLRRETRPLLELTDIAADIAAGDLTRPLSRHYPGELGVLSRSFESMREAIQRQFTDLRESESRYRQIFDAMADGLLLLDHDGIIKAANPRAAETYGWPQQQLLGLPITSLLRESDLELAQALRTPPVGKPLELSGVTCDHEGRELETEIGAVRLVFQGEPHALLIMRDVTDQQRLERQLLQSQKLESVGRLAGGIAHDFNNLLTPVLGYSEMLLNDKQLSKDSRGDLEAIRRAGNLASHLARQLLAFSRRQVLEMQDLDLRQTLNEFEPILRRTLREDIDLVIQDGDCPCRVRADSSQIEQIIMNLVINAMDAMPDGGRIEVATSCRTLDESTTNSLAELSPGSYTTLTVRDTGQGVPPEIADRVFEPFFTTKEAGRGTGLGLSTTHGIVKQHGGMVSIRNRPEGGCEVDIILPCIPESTALLEKMSTAQSTLPLGHGETVVVVEDNAMVRDFVQALLTKHGYAVRVYEAGQDCIDDLAINPRPADLLLTDVVMPRINGPELSDMLREVGVELPTLYMSGYTGETLIRRGLGNGRADFLHKPLVPHQLLTKLRKMLDKAERAAAE